MVKTIIFDLGGVIITLSQPEAVRRFKELGISDADRRLDSYTQQGIFGDLERGLISEETFRQEASKLARKELSWDECRWGWLGYAADVPKRNLRMLEHLRAEGYRLVLLSNTNPFMMSWVLSPEFDGEGHSLSHYMDAIYCSYQLGILKPDPEFFRRVIAAERIQPQEALFLDDGQRNIEAAASLGLHTLQPLNGQDWTDDLQSHLARLTREKTQNPSLRRVKSVISQECH